MKNDRKKETDWSVKNTLIDEGNKKMKQIVKISSNITTRKNKR